MSFVWHFTPVFALIPLLLLALTLALGVRAAKQAQEWERHVAARRASASQHRHKGAPAVESQADSAHGREGADSGRPTPIERAEALGGVQDVQGARNHDEAPTNVMEQREIRRALRRAQEEGKAARLQHHAHAASSADAAAGESSSRVDGTMAEEATPSVSATASASDSANNESSESAQAMKSTGAAGASDIADTTDAAARKTAARQSSAQKISSQPDAGQTGHAGHMADASDATSELERVHAAAALDAFDMATQPDLISFSLGAPRNIEESAQQPPESLEIKSMRQVAKAVPQDAHDDDAVSSAATAASGDVVSDNAAVASSDAVSNDAVSNDDAVPGNGTVADSDAVPAIDDANQTASAQPSDAAKAVSQATKRPVNDAQAFHRAEVEADVEVPDATSDSLGSGIEAVLARRAS
jgi:hypothetical protein